MNGIKNKPLTFIDAEITADGDKILDLGALKNNNTQFHSASIRDFCSFISDSDFICGHNIIHHDLKYIQSAIKDEIKIASIDTLYLSPLLFPKRPYHALLKDDKLQVDELNNPLNDCKKAADLFYDELNAFFSLTFNKQQIFCRLLCEQKEFAGFFKYIDFKINNTDIEDLIRAEYLGKICDNASIKSLVDGSPVELAYTLALIGTNDYRSVTPAWLTKTYPNIENIIKILCNTLCSDRCEYCKNVLNIHKELKQTFGFSSFRTYDGEPLQENAAQAAVDGKSLLAVFPTGGGKSITFQLPALMAGKAVHGLTVIISPLQSLMKDQVDNLNSYGIVDAVTINGLLNPIERANAIERVFSGSATLLYISPEQLRSRTIEKMLYSRNVVRFVIDEAHCFSAWGHDFRVDYLYIGDFIKKMKREKNINQPIPVSCFTATAKQKVIRDICDYFKNKLDLNLEIFATSATRKNLRYTVLFKETNEEKYTALRDLIIQKNCPTIVYVSRTKRTEGLAEKLTYDGVLARPFNGKMDTNQKIENQEAFINNNIQVIVATSAFGMGVDKKDVKLVIHYDISSSLEDYVQESGRAGRDPFMEAECYVLFNNDDLNKHFVLLNQTKLTMAEIQQVWRAIKDLTKFRATVNCSPLEIARQAGWDDDVLDIETRVKTAIAALEKAGFVERGKNMPRVYATSILAKNMEEASYRIENSSLFSEDQRVHARRIIKSLISKRSFAKAGVDDAESRVDYLADRLGLDKDVVIELVNIMRQDGLLEDSYDMSAYIAATDTENKSLGILSRFKNLENFILSQLTESESVFNLKKLNEQAQSEGIKWCNLKSLRTLLNYYAIKNYILKKEDRSSDTVYIALLITSEKLHEKYELRADICKFILEGLYKKSKDIKSVKDYKEVLFSLVGIYNKYINKPQNMELINYDVSLSDIRDALLYLSKTGAMKLEGGFLVLYQSMEIKRKAGSKLRYKKEYYRFLDEFYKQRIRQIHIVGEYANLMVRDYDAALLFVNDYFHMDFEKFISKYFSEDRIKEIDRNITPEKYKQLFDELSDVQSQIINDSSSKNIVVAAGPGSGKTRVLVHKLASLLLLEDVKHEQLLMLTFSRAAATEFKMRLISLIGNAANFVDIKTFHSYCFDLLGKIGSLEGVEDVIANATELIRNGEVEQSKINKTVLVIDEAQDMDAKEFELVSLLMLNNDNMRLIAVGDDDQNIFEFRGSNSKYLKSLIDDYGATKYEMTENYRSKSAIVSLGNAFVSTIKHRMKSNLIEAVQDEKGTVIITHHYSRYMTEPIVNQILKTRGSSKCCVLTNTNDEALQIMGLLLKKGVRAKLIQSLDGFRLGNLLEIRFFLMKIDKVLKSPTISDELWTEAIKATYEKYSGSPCLEICRNIFYHFESINPKKYRTDLEEFIKESSYEDFYDDESGTVYVSTIHKSKGREFDTVYMMLTDNFAESDEEKRKLYVGMTRAKDSLYIHCNTKLFSSFLLAGLEHIKDDFDYKEPEEISLQLTHKDVYLDFFKQKRQKIFNLRSGQSLFIDGEYLLTEKDNINARIAKLSRACSARKRVDILHMRRIFAL